MDKLIKKIDSELLKEILEGRMTRMEADVEFKRRIGSKTQ